MGFKIEQWRRAEIAGLAVLILTLWGVYLKTLSPAFPANDSPETISAAAELGIQHPPGYPLHTLLGRVAISAFSLGSPAWRMNCLSAALGLSCACLVAWLCRFLKRDTSFSELALAFMALGLWRSVWEQATEAKGGIYLLNLALCLALLAAALKRAPRLFALISGMALANHYMSALIFILPCAWYLLSRDHRALKGALWTGLWAVPGLSLYLLLPVFAAFEPFNLLNDPRALRGFLWIVLRRGYSQSELGHDWAAALDQLRLWALHSFSFGAFWVAPLGLLGIWTLWKNHALQARLLTAIYGLVFVSVVLLNRTFADVRFLMDIFLVPGQALLALSAGLGLAAALDFGGLRRLGWALALPLVFALGFSQFAGLDRSGDYVAYDYGRNLLGSLPAGAVYAADGDFHFMPLVYAQRLQGKRTDVELLVSPMLATPAYQARLFRRRSLKVEGKTVSQALGSLARQVPLSVSSFHPSIGDEAIAPQRLWQQGLAMRASLQAQPDSRQAPAWVIREDPRPEGEPLQRSLWPWYTVALMTLGNQFDALKRYGESAAAYQRALGMPGEKPRSHILFNLGQALQMQGKLPEAESAYARSLEAEPGLEISRQRLEALQKPMKH